MKNMYRNTNGNYPKCLKHDESKTNGKMIDSINTKCNFNHKQEKTKQTVYPLHEFSHSF